eukprot:1719108-Ditylum_brightwellii.AAC.1
MATEENKNITREKGICNNSRTKTKGNTHTLPTPIPIQENIAGPMEHATTGDQTVGTRQKDIRMQSPSRTNWEGALKTVADGVGWK